MAGVKRDRGGRKPKKRVCAFCVDKVEEIDYKDVAKLKKYITERGKILPRRISGQLRKASESFDSRYQKSQSHGITAIHY